MENLIYKGGKGREVGQIGKSTVEGDVLEDLPEGRKRLWLERVRIVEVTEKDFILP